MRQFRKLSRYIMQEDLLQPLITVQEAMVIAADLKLGTNLSKRKKAVIVSNIFEDEGVFFTLPVVLFILLIVMVV